MVVSVVRRGLGVREILVYRLHVFTFLMVSASFRDCWKSKEMLLFCLVMEKSNPTHQRVQMRKANLFIRCVCVWASACWVESETTDEYGTEPWENPGDPLPCLITCIDPSNIYH